MAFPTKDELIELWLRTTPKPITDNIYGLPGEEVFYSAAAVMAYLGQKLESAFAQMYFEDAAGPSFAEGALNLWWDANLTCPLEFAAEKLTIWGINHGGKTLVPYCNKEAVAIDPSTDTPPMSITARACRPGDDQDVLAKRLVVIFRNGDHSGTGATASGTTLTPGADEVFRASDRYRCVEVTAATNPAIVGEKRQIASVSGGVATLTSAFSADSAGIAWEMVELDQAGLHCENPDDIIGGNFFNLDMLAGNRDITRAAGETDDQLRTRGRYLADSVSAPAIERTLTRIMRAIAPGYSFRFINVVSDPEICTFFSESGDVTVGEAPDDKIMFFNDPRNDAMSSMFYSYLHCRAFFLVVMPLFSAMTDAERSRIYSRIYQSIEAIRAGGVDWLMVFDASLG